MKQNGFLSWLGSGNDEIGAALTASLSRPIVGDFVPMKLLDDSPTSLRSLSVAGGQGRRYRREDAIRNRRSLPSLREPRESLSHSEWPLSHHGLSLVGGGLEYVVFRRNGEYQNRETGRTQFDVWD